MDNATQLRQLNEEMRLSLIPALLLLAVLMVVGSVGNVLVLYNYINYFHVSSSRYFIITLAYFDLFVCVCILPLEMYQTLYLLVYNNVHLCKVYRTLKDTAMFGAAFLLVAIAADRYVKIRRPFHHVTRKSIKILCCFPAVVAFFMNLPASVELFGITRSVTRIPGVLAYVCDVDNEAKHSRLHKVYKAALVLIFVFVFALLVVLYSFLWHIVKRRQAKGDPLVRLKHAMGARTSSLLEPTTSSVPTEPSTLDIAPAELIANITPVETTTDLSTPAKSATDLTATTKPAPRTASGAAATDTKPAELGLGAEPSDPPTDTSRRGSSTMRSTSMEPSTEAAGVEATTKRRSSLKRWGSNARRVSLEPVSSQSAPSSVPKMAMSVKFTPQRAQHAVNKTTVSLFVVSIAFFFSHFASLAVLLFNPVSTEGGFNCRVKTGIARFLYTLCFVHSAANPFIYYIICRRFRDNAKQQFRTLCPTKSERVNK